MTVDVHVWTTCGASTRPVFLQERQRREAEENALKQQPAPPNCLFAPAVSQYGQQPTELMGQELMSRIQPVRQGPM